MAAGGKCLWGKGPGPQSNQHSMLGRTTCWCFPKGFKNRGGESHRGCKALSSSEKPPPLQGNHRVEKRQQGFQPIGRRAVSLGSSKPFL